MPHLARGNIKDGTLKPMWIRHLPSSIMSVLTVTEELLMGKITDIADKISKNTSNAEVNRQERTDNDSEAKCSASVLSHLESLKLYISEL